MKPQQALEQSTRALVDEAFREILAGNFESAAVHAVMGRRAGTIGEYARMMDLYAAAVSVELHSKTR